MELVIKLSKDDYKQVVDKWEINATHVIDAILKGTPLPKGHGRLIDEKEILNNPDGIYYDLYDVPEYLEKCIPTVIEADKEVDE